MARKISLSLENLAALGPEKLAAIILDEASVNAGFKRRINAALASQEGPQAIAKLIDRRLSGLERAKSFIDWDRERAFRDDIQGLCDSICKELCLADPAMGLARLIRFIATHESVFERVDDSSGKIQGIYLQAIEATGVTAAKLSPGDAGDLPDVIMSAMAEQAHGYLLQVSIQVIPHLPPAVLAAWDNDLAGRIMARDAQEADKRAAKRWFYSMTDQWRAIRQKLAATLGALDQLIAIEQEKPVHQQKPIMIARHLHEAGRMSEALDWVQREKLSLSAHTFGYGHAELDGEDPAAAATHLEASILTALGRKSEATQLLWDRFAQTLEPSLLRAHLKTLPDFEDIEAEERAMALVLSHENPLAAVIFFLRWNRRDLAGQCIIARHTEWRGSDWGVLPMIAEQLKFDAPLAASILYRVLLDDILVGTRSKAYGYGAKYLQQLDVLAADADADPARPAEYILHSAWRDSVQVAHKRKSRFWIEVDALSTKDTPIRGRKPIWTTE